jgi:hypothetical protein
VLITGAHANKQMPNSLEPEPNSVPANSPEIEYKTDKVAIAKEECKKLPIFDKLLAEDLDSDGVDRSLATPIEIEMLSEYAKDRKYLASKYPLQVQTPVTEKSENYDVDITSATKNPVGEGFYAKIVLTKTIFDKLIKLRERANESEKEDIRQYCFLAGNWNNEETDKVIKDYSFSQLIYEVVEEYFEICQRYHVPVFDERYYFLDRKWRLLVKLAGDMLKRTHDYETDWGDPSAFSEGSVIG